MAEKTYCQHCGEAMTADNSISNSKECMKCQSKFFRRMENENGCHMAIFLTCGAFNIPCDPLITPEDIAEYDGDKWERYCNALKENNALKKANGKFRTFYDGECMLRRIFGRELSESDFARYISAEKERTQSICGTEEQRERWGTGFLCRGLNFTNEVYNQLDKQYDIWINRYKGQTITPQLENSIITICKRNMVADYLLENGMYANAEKVQKMVNSLMESEQMRKKDEKPIEDVKIGALVTALEKKGLMESGDFLTYDELIEVMRDKFIKSPKYDYSLDVADQIILDFYNNMRINSEMDIVSDLPGDLKPDDKYGEFKAEESEEEQRKKRYANLIPVKYTEKKEE